MKGLLLVLAACSSSPKPTPTNHEEPQPQLDTLPAEVTTLVDRWTNCWHFAGEEATDDARRIEIAEFERIEGALPDQRQRAGDLARDEVQSAQRRLVIEQDA